MQIIQYEKELTKIEKSILAIQKAEPLALKYDGLGCHTFYVKIEINK